MTLGTPVGLSLLALNVPDPELAEAPEDLEHRKPLAIDLAAVLLVFTIPAPPPFNPNCFFPQPKWVPAEDGYMSESYVSQQSLFRKCEIDFSRAIIIIPSNMTESSRHFINTTSKQCSIK